MKILVIGNGFIATPVLQQLEIEGHDVLVFSRRAKCHIKSEQVEGDIFNFSEIKKLLSRGIQVVINSAWVTTQKEYHQHSSNYSYSKFAIELARFVPNTDVEHLIGFGSCAEYGPQVSPCVAGITPVKPVSLYAQQKALAFEESLNALKKTQVRLSWVRIFQPYGIGQDPDRLIPYLVGKLKSGDPVEIRDLYSKLDWITTRDIASAVRWILKEKLPIELDIGTGSGYTNLEILKHLKRLLDINEKHRFVGAKSSEHTQTMIVGKNSPLLASGWKPKDTLASGLEWMLSNA